jgi:hypothetical protein
MPILIITEKTSQVRDLRAALGDRFGQILPAKGHLLRLVEPREVEASWKSWACVFLKPDGLYPTRPATEGNKPAKLKAIGAALKRCDQVILATDCDREGQLIGQKILERWGYRGTVQRRSSPHRTPSRCDRPSTNSNPTVSGDRRPDTCRQLGCMILSSHIASMRLFIVVRGFSDERQSAHLGATGEDFPLARRLHARHLDGSAILQRRPSAAKARSTVPPSS